MKTEHPKSNEAAAAEVEALAIQAAEDRAEQRFDAVRAALESEGRAHEATRSREFHEWMDARSRTDDAWGRWAMAVDASRPA